MKNWDGAMYIQLSRDKIDLHRVEVMTDMILDGSNAECNRIFALIQLLVSNVYLSYQFGDYMLFINSVVNVWY